MKFHTAEKLKAGIHTQNPLLSYSLLRGCPEEWGGGEKKAPGSYRKGLGALACRVDGLGN